MSYFQATAVHSEAVSQQDIMSHCGGLILIITDLCELTRMRYLIVFDTASLAVMSNSEVKAQRLMFCKQSRIARVQTVAVGPKKD